jgi:hypothetical protein
MGWGKKAARVALVCASTLLLCALYRLVFPSSWPSSWPNLGPGLAAGEERVPDDEAGAIRAIVDGIVRIQQHAFDVSEPHRALRDAHAKAHGCVRARFTVADQLPPELAVGLFAAPRSYDAWVRFSNSDRTPHPDLEKDGRGMAVKLLGVPGKKLLDDEADATTHDFVMINHPVFFVRNAVDYVDFVAAQERGSRTAFFFSGPPWHWRLHELVTGFRITHHPIRSPLEERYFSMTPYRLGARASKFSARPCADSITPVTDGGDDALRTMMARQLARGPACFLLQVQLQADPHQMPVEDPTIEWREADAPFRTVARLDIPAQTFDTPAQLDACEALSFTPWHALPEHRPLGGVNRVRREVYRAISRLRHRLNGTPREEPLSDPSEVGAQRSQAAIK